MIQLQQHFRGLNPILKEVLLLLNSIACYRETVHARKNPSGWPCCLTLITIATLTFSTTTPISHRGKTLYQGKDYDLLKGQIMVSILMSLPWIVRNTILFSCSHFCSKKPKFSDQISDNMETTGGKIQAKSEI